MANRLRGEHAVTCYDGVERVLVFDVNAFCNIEERFGAPISALDGRLKEPTARDLPTLFHAGLAARHPDITEAEAARLLGLSETAAAVGAALQAAMPTRQSGGGGGGQADPLGAADGTGSGS